MELTHELSEKEKQIERMHYEEILRKQGLQERLSEMYKPLIETTKDVAGQVKQGTKEIAERIDEGIKQQSDNKEILQKIHQEPQIGEIVELIKRYPTIISYIRGEEVDLLESERQIVELITKLPADKQKMIADFFNQPAAAEQQQQPLPQQQEPPPLKYNIGKLIFNDIQEAKGNVEKIKDVLNNLTADEIMELKQHLAYESRYEDFSKSGTIRAITKVKNFQGFISDIKAMREKVGKGASMKVKFLPSDEQALKAQITKLIASFSAGNTNTINEISAISDELRRRGLISIDELKKLFRLLYNGQTDG